MENRVPVVLDCWAWSDHMVPISLALASTAAIWYHMFTFVETCRDIVDQLCKASTFIFLKSTSLSTLLLWSLASFCIIGQDQCFSSIFWNTLSKKRDIGVFLTIHTYLAHYTIPSCRGMYTIIISTMGLEFTVSMRIKLWNKTANLAI